MGLEQIRVGLVRPRQWVTWELGGGSKRNLISLASYFFFFFLFHLVVMGVCIDGGNTDYIYQDMYTLYFSNSAVAEE